jgi:multidrug resistance efflux pump
MNTDTKRIGVLYIILTLGSILLTGCSSLARAAELTPTLAAVKEEKSGAIVEGQVTPRDSTQLFFAVSGTIAEVLVEEGDQVIKGDILARLGDRETYQAAITTAKLELITAQQSFDKLTENASLAYNQALLELKVAQRALTDTQQKLADLDTDEYQNKIDDTRTKVADTKETLDDAQTTFDKYKSLDEDNATRKKAEDDLKTAQDDYAQAVRDLDVLVNVLDKSKADVEMASAQLDEAQREVDKRTDGPATDDLDLSEARLDNAKAQLSAAEAAMDRLDLIAPFDGIISNLDIAPGERAILNQPVIQIADFSEWYIDTSDLTEKEVVNIKIGQKVVIIPDALPGVQLTGVVEEISDTYIEKAGDITYKVRILLTETDPLLRWGMTVEVQFPTL